MRHQTSAYTACGGRSNDYSDEIRSPNFPYNYPDNAYCEYIIDPGTDVILRVDTLSLQTCCDHLKVMDRYGYEYHMSDTEDMINDYFRILFTSDSSVSDKGFRISWKPSRDVTPPHYNNCGSSYSTSSSGTITSPNYPNMYMNNADCEYIISPGTDIYLRVVDKRLEACCDHLRIYDQHGNKLTEDSNGGFSGNHFRVVFTSDSSGVDKGFQLQYEPDQHSPSTAVYPMTGTTENMRHQTSAYTACGGRSNDYSDEIRSPNFPYNYPDNAYCEYIIDPGTDVILRVDTLSLQTCCDHLKVMDRYGYEYHMSDTEDMINDYFRILFTSDSSVSDKGFRISWKPSRDVTPPHYNNCGSSYSTSSSGTITSPNYPNMYMNNADCEYIISPGTNIYLRVVDKRLEACCDHLRIYDQHGNKLTEDSNGGFSGNHFRVVFTSDSSGVDKGFQLQYEPDQHAPSTAVYPWTDHNLPSTRKAGCGGLYTAPNGVIRSPNFPDNYPDNAYCEYIIDPGIDVTLRVDTLFEACCVHVKVMDRYGYEYNVSDTANTTNDYFRIVFKSDHGGTGTGYNIFFFPSNDINPKLYYTSTYSTSLSGMITSPNYPNDYVNNAHCTYIIDTGTKVYLRITDQQLQRCCDHLMIYDQHGHKLTEDSNGGFSGNHFRVLFTSDSSGVDKGFKIQYGPGHHSLSTTTSPTTGHHSLLTTSPTTEKQHSTSREWNDTTTPGPSTCGQTSYSTTGVIESPNYPSSYFNNLHCVYHILTPTYSELRIDAIHLQEGHDYIRVSYEDLYGNHQNRTFTGSRRGTMVGKYFDITFTTDASNTDRGFHLSWNYDFQVEERTSEKDSSTKGTVPASLMTIAAVVMVIAAVVMVIAVVLVIRVQRRNKSLLTGADTDFHSL
ncbi:cubilin-like [Haliotis rufescens]|uniref:cubilin-like n=1 Tax=Haliotis rufescens TaxID=6454 RepID=UPI00201EE2EE|nr:cubilin-like [Haliotis rufescens]